VEKPAEEKVLYFAIRNASASSVHPRLCALCSYSCVYLWLAATPLSLSGAGTVLGLIVLHVNMTRRTM
jgi:hypothetical protein